jgi:hypothetical protein
MQLILLCIFSCELRVTGVLTFEGAYYISIFENAEPIYIGISLRSTTDDHSSTEAGFKKNNMLNKSTYVITMPALQKKYLFSVCEYRKV